MLNWDVSRPAERGVDKVAMLQPDVVFKSYKPPTGDGTPFVSWSSTQPLVLPFVAVSTPLQEEGSMYREGRANHGSSIFQMEPGNPRWTCAVYFTAHTGCTLQEIILPTVVLE